MSGSAPHEGEMLQRALQRGAQVGAGPSRRFSRVGRHAMHPCSLGCRCRSSTSPSRSSRLPCTTSEPLTSTTSGSRRSRRHGRRAARRSRRPTARVYGSKLLVEDITFSGADGHPIGAWFIAPSATPRPAASRAVSRSSGTAEVAGLPLDHTAYAAAGHAVLVMDSRAQGGEWAMGATGDPGAGTSASEHPGVMTRGIAERDTYYYRRLYVDAVRAVESAAEHPLVDPTGSGSPGAARAAGSRSRSRRSCPSACASATRGCRSCAGSGARSRSPASRPTPRSSSISACSRSSRRRRSPRSITSTARTSRRAFAHARSGASG